MAGSKSTSHSSMGSKPTPGSESEGGHGGGGGDGGAGGLGCRAIGEGEGGEAGVLGMEREVLRLRRRRHGFRALD